MCLCAGLNRRNHNAKHACWNVVRSLRRDCYLLCVCVYLRADRIACATCTSAAAAALVQCPVSAPTWRLQWQQRSRPRQQSGRSDAARNVDNGIGLVRFIYYHMRSLSDRQTATLSQTVKSNTQTRVALNSTEYISNHLTKHSLATTRAQRDHRNQQIRLSSSRCQCRDRSTHWIRLVAATQTYQLTHTLNQN